MLSQEEIHLFQEYVVLYINHIDKILVNNSKHFGLIRKGNKVKIYGLFHLHIYLKFLIIIVYLTQYFNYHMNQSLN